MKKTVSESPIPKPLTYMILGITLLNIIGHLLIYKNLPEIVPVHIGLNGETDGWGNKIIILFLATLPLIIFLGMKYLPKFDPYKSNYRHFKFFYGIFCLILCLFLSVASWIPVLQAEHIISERNNLYYIRLICCFLGLCLIISGNYMPKVAQNTFFGFKTPWAVKNKINWRKTQRMGGILCILSGILYVLTGIFYSYPLVIFSFAFLILGTIYVFYYSFYLSRTEKDIS